MRLASARGCLAGGFVCAALLVFPSAALARTIVLNWTERTNPTYGYPRMSFYVRSVTVTAAAWTVRAAFTNRSSKMIRVTNGNSSGAIFYTFGVIYPNVNCPRNQTCTEIIEKPTQIRPPIPRVLEPGHGWRGLLAGHGALPRGTLMNVSFGVFAVQGERPFFWLTQHAFRL